MMKDLKLRFLFYFLLFKVLCIHKQMLFISEKVGTEIDIHENRFYRVFPNEEGFISAQIIGLGDQI